MMTSFKTKVQRLIELMDKYRGGTVGDKVVFFVKYRSEMEEIVKTLNRYREDFIGFVADMEQYNKTNAAPQQAQVDAEKMREKEKEKEKEVVKQKQNQKSNGSPPADAESQVEELKRLREQNLLYRIMLEKRTELVSAAQADNPNEWQKIEQSLVGMDDKITKDDAKRILAPLKEEIKKIAQDEATAAAKPKMEKAQKMKHVSRVVFVDFDNGGMYRCQYIANPITPHSLAQAFSADVTHSPLNSRTSPPRAPPPLDCKHNRPLANQPHRILRRRSRLLLPFLRNHRKRHRRPPERAQQTGRYTT